MTLADLARQLGAYAGGHATDADLQRWLDAVLAADALGVERSDSTPWDDAPDDARLFWRLVYLFEGTGSNGAPAGGASPAADGDSAGAAAAPPHAPPPSPEQQQRRRLAQRVIDCLARTGSAAATFELLPVLTDQDRLCTIVGRHVRGVISRTGFLSVLAESGYPPHVKLWLEHAEPVHLARLCTRLARGEYDSVMAAFERRPA
ncbi:MAG TPA: hypothetical protein VFJ74_15730 [Gemmatimonadaceae bacterium]|nr:hypothetical protein [Gemmatimonadaceae bacterium]